MLRKLLLLLTGALLTIPLYVSCNDDPKPGRSAGQPQAGRASHAERPEIPSRADELQGEPDAEIACELELPDPRDLVSVCLPPVPGVYAYGRLVHGAFGAAQYHGSAVTVDDQLLHLNPVDGITPAWAVYRIPLDDYLGPPVVRLDWTGEPPAAGNLHVGLSRGDEPGWFWFSPADPGQLNLADLGTHVIDDELYITVAVTGGPADLNAVTVGDRCRFCDVDVTELLAPVLPWEVERHVAAWPVSAPAVEDYRVEESVDRDDGWEYSVISYVVDGLRLYAGVIVPPHAIGEQLPVLVYCHPGGGSARITGAGTFWHCVNDSELEARFIVVIPAFRGEQLLTREWEMYLCGGTEQYYLHDAGDVWALTECVVAHFPVDQDVMVISGYSRGAQVAQRTAIISGRFTGLIDISGRTDEWSRPSQAAIFRMLKSWDAESVPETAEDYYSGRLLELARGEISIWDLRQTMLHVSTAYFADRMPSMQIHHGRRDGSVSCWETERLIRALELTPGADYRLFIYEDGTHNFNTLTGQGEHFREFLYGLLDEPGQPGG